MRGRKTVFAVGLVFVLIWGGWVGADVDVDSVGAARAKLAAVSSAFAALGGVLQYQNGQSALQGKVAL